MKFDGMFENIYIKANSKLFSLYMEKPLLKIKLEIKDKEAKDTRLSDKVTLEGELRWVMKDWDALCSRRLSSHELRSRISKIIIK